MSGRFLNDIKENQKITISRDAKTHGLVYLSVYLNPRVLESGRQ